MLLLSDDARRWLGLLAIAGGALGQVGCADARGRFEDYQHRLGGAAGESAASAGASGACAPPAPDTVQGPALLAVDTSLTAGHPILFLGTIDTPPLDGTTAVHFAYRALDSLDRRTRVGDDLEVGPFALHDGQLSAPVPESTLDGDANPVLHGAPISSKMTLSGQICGVARFYCGTVSGSASGLVSGPFTGTFGISLLDGPDAVPDQPRFGCAADDVAPSL